MGARGEGSRVFGKEGSVGLFWLRGKDLNLRPLGYEFNTWSWMGIVAPSDQQHTCSTYLLVLVGSGSLVSNLLALSAALPTGDAPDSSGPDRVGCRPESSGDLGRYSAAACVTIWLAKRILKRAYLETRALVSPAARSIWICVRQLCHSAGHSGIPSYRQLAVHAPRGVAK